MDLGYRPVHRPVGYIVDPPWPRADTERVAALHQLRKFELNLWRLYLRYLIPYTREACGGWVQLFD